MDPADGLADHAGDDPLTVLPIAPPDVPAFVEQWVRALFEPDTMDVLRGAGDRAVEVRLYASGGAVRKRVRVAPEQ
jgi:hypothetical protein